MKAVRFEDSSSIACKVNFGVFSYFYCIYTQVFLSIPSMGEFKGNTVFLKYFTYLQHIEASSENTG